MYLSKKLIATIIAAVGIAAGTTAFAAIPDAGGVIHGCYDKQSGQLRVTDTATAQPKPCSGKEAALDWNQQGLQGPKGDSGLSQGYIWTHFDLVPVGLNTPLGGMAQGGLLSAKLVIGTTNNVTTGATCTLYSGPDPVDSSSTTLYSPTGASWTTMYLAGRSTHKNANVVCSANNGFARDLVITATQLDSITDLS